MKRMTNGLILGMLLTVSVIGLPFSICAQPVSYPVEQGDRVRLSARNYSAVNIEGTVTSITSEHVLIQGTGAERWELQWREINELEIQREKWNTGRGASTGLLVGVLGGGLIGAVTYKECNDVGFMACFMQPEDRGDAFMLGAVVGLLPGLLLGTLIGASTKSVDWRRVEMGISGQPSISAQPVSPKSLNPTIRLKIPLGN